MILLLQFIETNCHGTSATIRIAHVRMLTGLPEFACLGLVENYADDRMKRSA
ncbi:hypothetical protein Y023_5669 [Burkholderia pseudomallei A79D]|nr:hypothetical protein Y023_5669 [Burkholderia pseudomallei A79D]KGX95453.1 hypothetical protein X997_5508 [Burkholderia pseudomallei A79C]